MDKSLKFFLGIDKAPVNRDTKTNTGLSTQTVEGDVIINYFDPADPTRTITRTEKKPYKYDALASEQNPGQFISYLGNSAQNDVQPFAINPENQSDIDLESIIIWSQQNYPSMALHPKHIAYLDKFRTMPANRFIVLRRFKGPCRHNLFAAKKSKPMSTMVGYYDFENMPMKISFNEKWKQFDTTFMSIIQDVVGIQFDTIPGVGALFSKAATSPLGQDLLYLVGQRLGFITPGDMPYGDPNLIHDAAMRDVSGETLSTGLESEITVDFETTYVMREILGIDGKAAMLDILANITTMATGKARFVSGNIGPLNSLLKSLESGSIEGIVNSFKEALMAVVNSLSDKEKTTKEEAAKASDRSLAQKGVDNAFSPLDQFLAQGKEVVSQVIRNRYSRYKWKLRGAVGAMTGAPTAPWHISIGNPKFPWFVCGNMVLESCELIPEGELGYNDMFDRLTVKIKLRSGRVMGGEEIETLFNAGTGRIYDTPEKVIQYVVPEGTTVNVPNDGGDITFTQGSKEDITNAPVTPESLNQLPDGAATNFSINNVTEPVGPPIAP